jgi:uncharacterized protein YjbI with pentapeptide repeats
LIVADQEQVKLLKRSVEEWNEWRKKNPNTRPDLSKADLSGANLIRANLRWVNFCEANLRRTLLGETDLSMAVLFKADLSGANLVRANLLLTQLSKADLSKTVLWETLFLITQVIEADLSHARVGDTTFSDTDLSEAKGLDSIIHGGPSTIGIDTIYKSRGKIPKSFLIGAGVPVYPKNLIST